MRIKNKEFRIKPLNSKALTLVEVLIAMGIAVVVGALLLIIIVNSAGLYYKQSSKLEGGLNSNDALFKIRQSVKEASSIDPLSSSEQLVLKISAIDSSGNIIDNTFDDFVFLKDQNKLRFKILPDALSSRKIQDQIFSTNVESITFQYFNLANPPVEVSPQLASKVKVSLILKQKSGADFETTIATSEASLRND